MADFEMMLDMQEKKGKKRGVMCQFAYDKSPCLCVNINPNQDEDLELVLF